ncbi:zinc ribbon domain-containing protein [Streptomyces sp. NPDC000151]|uniref:zinc ribbon domain-containing protein n=1 Tax=Streptomyces sp. NPDC000151 TaxID=3154244 RepID=UPI003320A121
MTDARRRLPTATNAAGCLMLTGLFECACTAAHPRLHRTSNPYLFRGLITHGLCNRRMQAQWSHGDAYYRCRFSEEYALANRKQHPRNVYLRESWITPPLDDWLGKVFAPHRLHNTIDLMTATEELPDHDDTAIAAARVTVADCEAKPATRRAALEAGADPALVSQWITETQAKRAGAEAALRTTTGRPDTRMSRDEITRLVHAISDLVAVVRQARTEDKAEIYRQLGLRLTYDSARMTVRAELTPGPQGPPSLKNDKSPRSQRIRGEMVRVRGPTRSIHTCRYSAIGSNSPDP